MEDEDRTKAELIGELKALRRQREAEIAALLDASDAVLKKMSFEDTARAIFDRCKTLIRATVGYVALISEDGSENEILFLDSGWLPRTVGPDLPIPIRKLRDEAYGTGRGVYENNFESSKWMKYMPEGHDPPENVLFAPLVVNGKSVGLLGLANKEGGFTDNDTWMASAFGKLTAISLRNSLAFDERMVAEQALKESQARLQNIIENNADGIIIVDADGMVRYVNPAAETILDRRGDELLNETVGFPMVIGESTNIEIVLRDGKLRIVEMRIVETDWEGKPAQLASLRDVSERKQQEKERLELEAQLLQAQKMEAIGDLAGGIAHDFNNILSAIMGYSELAKMKAPDGSEMIADLNKALEAGNRARDLVKQILTVGRRHKQERRPVQVRYLVKEALKLLRATLPTTIEIQQDMAGDTGVVSADPTQIHQVIMNLGTNAGQAMETGGVLEVGIRNVEVGKGDSRLKYLNITPGAYLLLTVSDTGHGMSSDIIDQIFDPYFTTKATGGGTGLGLSVVLGILRSHGGGIRAYSRPGEGTTFEVYLPLIEEAQKPAQAPEGAVSGGSERLLFIDDEQTVSEIGKRLLEELGYEVVAMTSSVEALDLFRAGPDRFNLVITDMTMPHLTGDQLTMELMKIRPDIPVILCTGYSRQISEKRAREIGIKAFLLKPVDKNDLARTVRHVLDAGKEETGAGLHPPHV